MSGRGRPQAPQEVKVVHWDAAHRWTTDMFLLKGNYVVGLYSLPPDFSAERTYGLLQALAHYIAKAEGDAGKESPPVRSETNRTSSAAGTGR